MKQTFRNKKITKKTNKASLEYTWYLNENITVCICIVQLQCTYMYILFTELKEKKRGKNLLKVFPIS